MQNTLASAGGGNNLLRSSPQIPDSSPREALHPPYTPRLGRDAVILLRRPGPSRGLEAIFDNRCIFERRCGPYCKLVDARLGVWGAWAQTVATWSAAHTGTQQRDSNKTYGERCCRISSQKHRFFENRGFGRWLGCHFDGIARHCSGKLEGQPGDSGRGLEWDYGWSKSRIRQVPIHNTSHPPKPRSSLTTDFVTGCGVESRHANQWCENHSGWWTRGGRHRGYGDGGSTPSHLTKNEASLHAYRPQSRSSARPARHDQIAGGQVIPCKLRRQHGRTCPQLHV